MKKNLPEGFAMTDMAPIVGWGQILTAPYIQERYFSLRLLGKTLFLCRGRMRPEYAYAYGIIGHLEPRKWFRWWLQ